MRRLKYFDLTARCRQQRQGSDPTLPLLIGSALLLALCAVFFPGTG